MLNKLQIIGRLGADPESRNLPSGDAVTNIKVATTEKWKDKTSGEMREETEWHRVSFFGRLAEIAAEYLVKGSLVYVEGSIKTRKYMVDGVEKYATEVKGNELKMLSAKPDGAGGGRDGNNSTKQQQRPAPAPQNKKPASPDDGDVPF